MIISASRRTDIPALYADWLMNRLEAGFCIVRNPFNPKQESVVSLAPKDVEVIVFWTKDPRPLMDHLDYLDQRRYRYYFQFTLNGYPHWLEPGAPDRDTGIQIFRDLVQRLGSKRVVWRYDPIIFSKATGPEYHLGVFEYIARQLAGHTQRVVISLWDDYRKCRRRMREIEDKTGPLGESQYEPEAKQEFFTCLTNITREFGMEISSCSENSLESYGINKGKCIDDQLIEQVFHIEVDSAKDPNQRRECGCIASKDIGAYDTCILGCRYCYGVGKPDNALARYLHHDPHAPCLATSFSQI
jgi:hypothetical protein